jgi:hypothetical protein
MLNKNFKTFGKRQFGFLTTFLVNFFLGGWGWGGGVKVSLSTALPLSKTQLLDQKIDPPIKFSQTRL